MTRWQLGKGASAEEKRALVTEVLKRDGREGGAAGVIKCLDAAFCVPGHSDLSISDVVAAYAKRRADLATTADGARRRYRSGIAQQ